MSILTKIEFGRKYDMPRNISLDYIGSGGPHYREVNPIGWDEYFMKIACLVAKKSKDAQTQCGTVLVHDNRIIATGYNSPPKKVDDTLIPNVRPEKYKFYQHSEINAIINATVPLCTLNDVTAYINGIPCVPCLCAMINANVTTIYHLDMRPVCCNTDEDIDRDFLIEQAGLNVVKLNKELFI